MKSFLIFAIVLGKTDIFLSFFHPNGMLQLFIGGF